MRRFFTEPINIKGDVAEIYDDASHITRVLRLEKGDKILVFDGTGFEYTAAIKYVDRNICKAEIISKSYAQSEPVSRVTLFQGIPKSGKMEQIIQKAVEMGVFEIVPVITERCVVKISGKKVEEEKAARWQKVSVEASKQCGRGIIPKIYKPMLFNAAIEKMLESKLMLMPYEGLAHDRNRRLRTVLNSNRVDTISIMVGPEGGFTDFEASFASSHGVELCGLGTRILRTETVGTAILAILMYENNEI